MSKVIIGIDSLKELEKGIDTLAEAVKCTLGPKGKNVVIKTLGTPLITNDGVTIAKSITLDSDLQNIGAMLIKEASIKTNELAGDGTTTACVLAQSIIKEGIKNIIAGANPIELNLGINTALDLALKELQNISRPLNADKDIEQIANISCADTNIGKLISEAYKTIGRDGVITLTEGQQLKTTLDIVNGIKIDRGFTSTYFCTDMTKEVAEYSNPLILLVDDKLDNFNALVSVIQYSISVNQPLVILANDYSEDVLSAILINKLKSNLKCLPLKSPAYGTQRKDILSDLALIFETKVFTNDLMSNLDFNQLGNLEKVITTKYETTFIKTKTNDLVEDRLYSLQKQFAETSDQNIKNLLQDRISKLKGKVAVIKVGGASDIEVNERKLRVEDAIFACKSAVTEGIVIGGGSVLLKIKKIVESKLNDLCGDKKLGAHILLKTLEAPLRQIAKNAGLDDGVIVQKVADSNDTNYGYDAQNNVFGDLKKLGIIDPTKVIRCGLQNAVSVATTILTTNAIICD